MTLAIFDQKIFTNILIPLVQYTTSETSVKTSAFTLADPEPLGLAWQRSAWLDPRVKLGPCLRTLRPLSTRGLTNTTQMSSSRSTYLCRQQSTQCYEVVPRSSSASSLRRAAPDSENLWCRREGNQNDKAAISQTMTCNYSIG
jgi:hypothetical protein